MVMERVQGRILRGREVLIDKIELWLEFVTSSGRKPEWHGGFPLPQGSRIRDGEYYVLELADGRSGEMFINELQPSGHEGSTALFTGSDHLR
jgi:hypothetical protein